MFQLYSVKMHIDLTLKNKLFPLLFFIGLLSLFISKTVQAQNPPLVFKSYTVQDGLSYNYVSKIFQDSEGMIWLGTPDGLDKFNGYDFITYRSVIGDSTSLISNHITSIVEDQEQNLWISTWGGGISIYNRKTDTFSTPKLRSTQSFHIGDIKFISELHMDKQGYIWACSSHGLLKIKPSSGEVRIYVHSPNNPNSISHNRVVDIVEDKEGNFWLGTYGGGVNHFDAENEVFTSYKHQKDNPHSLAENVLNSLYLDNKDRLWVATSNNGLDMMRPDNPGIFKHYQHQFNKPHSLSNNQVTDITQTLDGNIWVGTDNGLCLFNEEKDNFYVYKKSAFDPKSLSASEIKGLYADREGRLWVGTYNGGINVFDDLFINTLHYYKVPEVNSLTHDDITALLYLDEENILVGTDGGGLNVFNPQTHSFRAYTHQLNNPASIGGNKIKDILQDRKGRIWLCFWNGGLDLFDPQKHSFKHYKQSDGPGKGPNNNNIISLAEDDEGYIWMSTLGGGVNKLNPETETFEYYKEEIISKEGLEDNRVVTIYADSQNTIWIGTSLGSFYKFDRERKQFIPQQIQVEGESKNQVQCIWEDSKSNLWLGLEGGGLKLFNRENGNFVTYSKKDGLPSDHVNTILEDKFGQLWLSTNRGISSFHPLSNTFTNYDLNVGLQGLQFNREAGILFPNGALMFGGSHGFNFFHPDSLSERENSIQIVFTNFFIFNKPVSVQQESSPLKAHINKTDTLVLSPEQSVFSIEFAGLDYTFPSKVNYQYKLEGFIDESWQMVGQDRKATYTNLNPGTYHFYVTTTGATHKRTHTRQLTIIVTPPWWKTLGARILFIVSLLSVGIAIYQSRIRIIKRQKKKLEALVAERTSKLDKAVQDLQKANESLHEKNYLIQEQKEEIQSQAVELVESNEEIRQINQKLEERVEMRTADLKKSNQELDNFVYRVSHDIRAPLASVMGLLELIDDEEDPNQLRAYLNMTSKSIYKLDSFVNDILDYSRNSRMQIASEKINFPELVSEVREELQYMENCKRLKVREEYNLEADHFSDSRRLLVIFRNLISNSIKYLNVGHTENFLSIRIEVDHNHFAHITLQDNGIGIRESVLPRVFDMFFRASSVSQGSGIGLYIVKETVEKLGGEIEIQSEIDVGTSIRISLPGTPVQKTVSDNS